MDPPPSLKVASKFAMKLERQIKGINKEAKTNDTVALAGTQTRDWSRDREHKPNSSNEASQAQGQGQGLFCRYCKKTNHNIEDCLRLKHKRKMERSGNTGGYYRGANSAHYPGQQQSEGLPNQDNSSDHNATLRLSSEDCNRLMAILQQNSSTVSSSTNTPQANLTRTTPTPVYPNFAGITTLSSHKNSSKFIMPDSWIIDTGASDHMCNSLMHFISYKPVKNFFVTLPDNTQVTASHIGLARTHSGLLLYDTLHIPTFSFNLISVSKLTKTLPVSLLFKSNVCIIQDLATQMMTGSAREARGLYQLQPFTATQSSKPFVAASFNFKPQDIDLWHCRLGHLSNNRTQLLLKCNPDLPVRPMSHCEHCHFSRQKRLPFSLSNYVSTEPFELIHTDIWGPLNTISYDGFSYFLTVVDDHTRAVWTFLMKHKSDTRQTLQIFCKMVHTQFNQTVRTIRSDQGMKFQMRDFYTQHGIEHQMSCVERQEQNGRVERKHQDILNVVRALRFQAGLPLRFWSDCILHAVHLLNRLPTALLSNLSPYQKLYNRPPSYHHLRVFGCLCYASSLNRNKTKFDSRAKQGIYLGTVAGIKGHKIYDLHTHTIFVSRDVLFHENIFPFLSTSHEHTSSIHDPVASDVLFPAGYSLDHPTFEAPRGPSHTPSVEDDTSSYLQ
ncbi:Retrovirus-related Pol polyprotein from transposon RE2 [Linum perenne]